MFLMNLESNSLLIIEAPLCCRYPRTETKRYSLTFIWRIGIDCNVQCESANIHYIGMLHRQPHRPIPSGEVQFFFLNSINFTLKLFSRITHRE